MPTYQQYYDYDNGDVRQTFTESMILHGNFTFADLEQAKDGNVYPNIRDLWIIFPLAILLYLLRKIIFERIIARNIGLYMGLKPKIYRTALPRQPQLLASFSKSQPKDVAAMDALTSASGLSAKQIEVWFHVEQTFYKPSTLQKFEEGFWRLIFYTISFSVGLYLY